MAAYRHWTPEEVELLRRWRRQRLPTREMAKKLGRSRGSVTGKIFNTMDMPRGESVQPIIPKKEFLLHCQECGKNFSVILQAWTLERKYCSECAVIVRRRNWRRKHPRRYTEPAWSQEDLSLLHDLWEKGGSLAQIAKTLSQHRPGTTRNAVAGKLHRMGHKRGTPSNGRSIYERANSQICGSSDEGTPRVNTRTDL